MYVREDARRHGTKVQARGSTEPNKGLHAVERTSKRERRERVYNEKDAGVGLSCEAQSWTSSKNPAQSSTFAKWRLVTSNESAKGKDLSQWG